MKKTWELILRLLALLGLFRPPHRVPEIPPLPPPFLGATAAVFPAGLSWGYGPTGPTGATISTGPVGPAGTPGWDVYIPVKDRIVSASLPIKPGYLVEFQSFAYGYRSSESVTVTSKVGINLVTPDGKVMISESPSTSPNPRASSIPWVASIVETKLAELKVQHPPLDLDLLEVCAKQALAVATEHALSVFAYYLVGRVEPSRVPELWEEAVVRYVMES